MAALPANPTTGGNCGSSAEMYTDPACTMKYNDGTAFLNFLPSLSNGACMN